MSFKEELILLIKNRGFSEEQVDDLILKYINLGINRNEMYKAIWDIFQDYYEILTKEQSYFEERFDYLGDIMTALTGDTSKSCILKFKGDPDNVEELAKIVREKKWMNP
ncbi:hypothetical protein ACFODO_07755 [Acinetobacter sichuanensis]|nr:hypothetical protein [Acinetobacter sichuanensis]